jgi:diacylglycerol kinase family enzyme
MLTAVGNGRYFGGGMKICPNAKLDSGTLDIVIVGDFTKGDVVTKGSRLYDGSHLSLDLVKNVAARKLVVAPVEADELIPLELDGERPGHLPATYEVLPGALRLRA